MSCWRVRNAADVLPQPAAAGPLRSAPRNKTTACLYCAVIALAVLLCCFAVFRLADDVAGHYAVEISIEASDEFRSIIVADDGNTTMSSSPVRVEQPSFDVTVRVENHYHHHICFSDWGVAVLRHDGAPLGRATFPDDLCALSMGEGNVTAATASGLAGLALADEALRGQEAWGEVDLRIDMRHHVLLADSSADDWLRCTARLDGQPTAAPCKFKISSRS